MGFAQRYVVSSGPCGDLQIATIQSRLYRIEEHDGYETVYELDDNVQYISN